jgi:hypothetical protein
MKRTGPVLLPGLVLSLLAAPLTAEAQLPAAKVYRIGYLTAGVALSTLTGPEPRALDSERSFTTCASSGTSRSRTW